MNISPIMSVNTHTSFVNQKTSKNNNNTNFMARLSYDNSVVRNIGGETIEGFKRVMSELAEILKKDTIQPNDIFKIKAFNGVKYIDTEQGLKNANLEVSLEECSVPFFYNVCRSSSKIVEDLYNAYKHVRYEKHYKPVEQHQINHSEADIFDDVDIYRMTHYD